MDEPIGFCDGVCNSSGWCGSVRYHSQAICQSVAAGCCRGCPHRDLYRDDAGISITKYDPNHRQIPGIMLAFNYLPCSGDRMMRNKRLRVTDRRKADIPKALVKDSNGLTINESRRKLPDRRTGNIVVEWIDEIVIH